MNKDIPPTSVPMFCPPCCGGRGDNIGGGIAVAISCFEVSITEGVLTVHSLAEMRLAGEAFAILCERISATDAAVRKKVSVDE